jgi:hypothetical protein
VSKDNNTHNHNDIAVYHSQEALAQKDFERPVVSSMLNNIFSPSNRVPKAILREMVSDTETLEKQITAQLPLNQTKIEISKPYWKKGQNARDFDQVNVDIYGAICLADDRHCLDCIVAWGALIQGAHNLTLRQLCDKYIKLDVDWERFNDQSIIDSKLVNRGVYFHVKVNDVLRAMNLKTTQQARERLLQRLRRLSLMTLIMSFEKDGKLIPNRSSKVNLVDRDYFALLDMNKIKNKANISDGTYTDLIVNVSSFYLKSLDTEGHISRKRFLNAYPDLVGKNSVVDFWKFIDSNAREYIHIKWLSELVIKYLDDKINLFGINTTLKIRDLMNEVLAMREQFREHFNMILKAEDNPKKRIRHQDYRIYWLNKIEKD